MALHELLVTVSFDTVTCCACGILFGIPTTFSKKLREGHVIFWCPAGHQQHFPSETEIEKLRRENEQLRKKKEWAEQEARVNKKEAETLKDKLSSARKETKRIKERVKNGICVCCRRTFSNLAHHMKTQHPEFTHVLPED